MDAEALASVGVDVSAVEVPPVAPRGHLPFTPGARSALEGCLAEARRGGERRLSPEHLLLALASAPPPDLAVAVLARFDIGEADLRCRLDAPLREAG
ncbi:MAG: hypothetical protein GEV08_18040 [Acidimicrobiia bacterium]|nr:hypothetical protein [Acidimicrobiia bacterium]